MDAPGRSDSFQAGQSFGKFYLVQLIGEGGTSRIFKAMQQPINRIVALKIPSFQDAGNILTPDEFLSEATLMARLEHGHVVRIYDFGVHGDSAFICMEYVEGWNLLELIEARGPLPVPAVLAAGIQTLEGLAYAHSRNVLHLDLSPANVLLSKTGTAKLSDFGMAGKKFRASEGRIVGTPAFLSPEHVAGKPGTPQSDLFSFASLLYFAATGEPLFDPGPENARVTQAIREIESARETPPEDRLKRLPRLLYKPVLTALESKDPDRLMRELREAWKKLEGDERPESVLVRELELDGDPMSPGSAPDDLPAGPDLRDRYIRLREGGKHREAVALLEKAMRRQPDNPLLRELLETPPAKAKSAPVTVDVGVAPGGDSTRSHSAGATRRASRGSFRIAAALAGILAVTVGVLAWGKVTAPATAEESGSQAEARREPRADAMQAAAGNTAGATAHTLGVNPAIRDTAARDAAAKNAVAVSAHSGMASVAFASKTLPGTNTGSVAPMAAAIRRIGSKRESRAARNSPSGRSRPPAVALSGPAGTKVAIDDSVEWTVPGPAAGRQLSPGLVNITLTPPGSLRPISTSLFISADTLYRLNLEADGGFSVTRMRR